MRKKIVLLVDDDSFQIKTLTDYFQTSFNNIDFFEASNGKQALEIIKYQEKIDLIVSDIRMPEMDGLELVEAAKRFNHDLPILLTSENCLYNQATIKSLGAYDFLPKPFTRDVFVQVVGPILAIENPL